MKVNFCFLSLQKRGNKGGKVFPLALPVTLTSSSKISHCTFRLHFYLPRIGPNNFPKKKTPSSKRKKGESSANIVCYHCNSLNTHFVIVAVFNDRHIRLLLLCSTIIVTLVALFSRQHNSLRIVSRLYFSPFFFSLGLT